MITSKIKEFDYLGFGVGDAGLEIRGGEAENFVIEGGTGLEGFLHDGTKWIAKLPRNSGPVSPVRL